MKQPDHNQSGFAAIELVFAIILVIAIGAAGYFAYQAHHKTSSTTTSSTPSSSHSTTVATTTPTLKIPELGIQIPLNDEFKGLAYTYDETDGVTLVHLSTSDLTALDATCSANNSPLGTIRVETTKVASDTGDDGPGTYMATAHGKYFYYDHPQYACGETAASQQLALKLVKDLPTILPNISSL